MEEERKNWSFKEIQNNNRLENLKDDTVKVLSLVAKKTCYVVLRLLWHFLHLIISFWHVLLNTTLVLQSYLISSGLFKKYKALNINKLQYLAIVVDNEEAHDTLTVIKLLQWLSRLGVKHVCLYDMDGMLKKSKTVILQALGDDRSRELESDDKTKLQEQMVLEFASFSDGKEGMAKAADLLCSKYLKIASLGGQEELVFTESDISTALRVIGCEWSEPNLLLTYGSVRCHFGFPAWRMKYTEIVHMGPLKSMKFEALVKAIEGFTRVKQNYGT